MPCLSNETKSYIIQKISNSHIDSSEAESLAEFIEAMPVCSIVEMPKGKKGERKLTKYNIFLSPCLKKEKMKQCIVKWNLAKECMKNGGSFESCKAQQGY